MKNTSTKILALLCSLVLCLLVLRSQKSVLAADDADPTANLPIADGPFKPDMDSLKQYQCPEWFRDAKFGIWAHWGPQAVPMEGDWYARKMYEQGSEQTTNTTSPTTAIRRQFGYKDIIPLWKAEKWDPDRLMPLYKKAGRAIFREHGLRITMTSSSGIPSCTSGTR